MTNARPADLEYIGHIVAERWSVLRLLGAGGMGTVYQAQDRRTHEYVALKRLRPEYLREPEVVLRFAREAESGRQMVHPNIANVTASGQDPADGSLFIVQEYLTGMDLRQRMTGGRRMSPFEAVAIMAPVIDGLACAHSYGIVHRDIKPANIFLSLDGNGILIPKVIDFGVSKVLGPMSEGLRMTRTGIAVGTPQYMSPEQLRGEKGIDERVDIWAVGVVLYLVLAGRHPFQAEDAAHVMLNIISAEPPRLEMIAPQVSRALANVVHRALMKDRAKRYATMADFRNELLACPLNADGTGRYQLASAIDLSSTGDGVFRDETFVGEEGERAAPDASTVVDGIFTGDSSPSFPAPILPNRPSQMPRPRRERPWLLMGGALLAVALVTLGVAFWTRGRAVPAATAPVNVAPSAPVVMPVTRMESGTAPAPAVMPPITRLR